MILSSTMHLGKPVVNIEEDIRDYNDPDESVACIYFSVIGDKRISIALNMEEVEDLATQLQQVAQAIRQGTDDLADCKNAEVVSI